MAKNARNRVLVCGAYGFGNLGDESILEAVVNDVRSVDPQSDISVVTWDPLGSSQRLSVRAIQASVTSALRAVLEHDLVLCGGGAILAEYGCGTSLIHLLKGSPGYPLTMITWAHLLGKPSVIYAVGVEEMQVRLFRYWVQLACRFARVVTVRDAESADLLRKWRVPMNKVHVTADPVFGLGRVDDERDSTPWSRILSDLGQGFTVGIGICFEPLLHTANMEMMVDFYTKLVDWLTSNRDAHVVFIPMNTNPGFDSAIMTEIQSQIRYPAQARLLQGLTNPRQIHRVINHLDLVISSRMHLLIFAALNHVPLIATSRTIKGDSKLDSLMYHLDQGAAVPLNASGLARIKAEIGELLSDVTSAREILKNRVVVLQNLARQNQRLLASILTEGMT